MPRTSVKPRKAGASSPSRASPSSAAKSKSTKQKQKNNSTNKKSSAEIDDDGDAVMSDGEESSSASEEDDESASSGTESEESEEESEAATESEEEEMNSTSEESGSSSSASSSSSSSTASPSPESEPQSASSSSSSSKRKSTTPSKGGQKRKRNNNDEEEETEEQEEKSSASSNKKQKKSSSSASSSSSKSKKKQQKSSSKKSKPSSSSSKKKASHAASSDEESDAAASRNKRRKSSEDASDPAIMDPDELGDEWRCNANDALTFKLVRSAPERDSHATDSASFHPTFTHQLWDEEEIVGYKKVKASVSFTSGALYTYIKAEYEAKYKGMHVPEIQELIASKLRGGYTTSYDDFKKHIHDPFQPPGKLIHTYSVPSVELTPKETITYEVYSGRFDDPFMREYHLRLQFFLLFFIDRSSYINDRDLVWEIILLFQKRVCHHQKQGTSTTTYHIVGYTTLYKFLAYPNNWKMRLSQILILPCYQRAGHGRELLQLVYTLAEERGMQEVNIEDPSPVFQMLRDLTDLALCRKHKFFDKASPTDTDPLERWDPQYASVVRATLRITMSQVRRCFEIFRLFCIYDRHKGSKSMTTYRLDVKARLFREEQETLTLCSQRLEERKEKLADMYNELELHYNSVIRRARLTGQRRIELSTYGSKSAEDD